MDSQAQFVDVEAITQIALLQRIEEELGAVQQLKRTWYEMQNKMKENAAKAKTKIKLNIGGQIFMTSKSTLLSMEGTYFHAMLSSEHGPPDEDGEYFIDRNPECFRLVLDYLIAGKLNLVDLPPRKMKMLKADMDYYRIKYPFVDLTAVWYRHDNLSRACIYGAVVSHSGQIGVLGNVCDPASYKVKLVGHPEIQFNGYVGLSPKTKFQWKETCIVSGWFMGPCGYLCSQDGEKPYRSVVMMNDTIEVLFDKENKTISYRVNDDEPIVAFKNVQNNIYPAVAASDDQVTFALISCVI